MTPAIKAILFDLDGVLVDATDWHYGALNRALMMFGYSISRYEHLSSYNGLPTRRKLEMLTVEKGLPKALHGLISSLKQVYTREEIYAKCRPSFEKEYMVRRLAREGYPMAVCSNAVRDAALLMVTQSGIAEYFEFVLTNEDIVRHKPDPEIYLKAVQRMGLNASEVLAIEDAPPGIEAARRAGVHVWPVKGVEQVEYFGLRRAIDTAIREGV